MNRVHDYQRIPERPQGIACHIEHGVISSPASEQFADDMDDTCA